MWYIPVCGTCAIRGMQYPSSMQYAVRVDGLRCQACGAVCGIPCTAYGTYAIRVKCTSINKYQGISFAVDRQSTLCSTWYSCAGALVDVVGMALVLPCGRKAVLPPSIDHAACPLRAADLPTSHPTLLGPDHFQTS